MALSVFDLFKIGIGPSSSHTVGPMIAADRFVRGLAETGVLTCTRYVSVELFGSLGATGKGHGSIGAVALGLLGERPDQVDPTKTPAVLCDINDNGVLWLLKQHPIEFDLDDDIILHRNKRARFHVNAMKLVARNDTGCVLSDRMFYSIGGGFVIDDDQVSSDNDPVVVADPTLVRHPFRTGDELLAITSETGHSISDIVLLNEQAWHTKDFVHTELLRIWSVMQECVREGCTTTEGVLPGGLKVPRRAPAISASLSSASAEGDPLTTMDYVSLYALAVNE